MTSQSLCPTSWDSEILKQTMSLMVGCFYRVCVNFSLVFFFALISRRWKHNSSNSSSSNKCVWYSFWIKSKRHFSVVTPTEPWGGIYCHRKTPYHTHTVSFYIHTLFCPFSILHKHVNTETEEKRRQGGRDGGGSDPPRPGENTPEALKWQQLLKFTPPSVPRKVRRGVGGGEGQMKGFFDVPRLG